MKPHRIVLYARVSTKGDKQDKANQLHQLRDYAQRQGWEIVHEYIDQASGKTGDRMQFKAMMAAASMREFDMVLFWSLDRLSREGVLQTLTSCKRSPATASGGRATPSNIWIPVACSGTRC